MVWEDVNMRVVVAAAGIPGVIRTVIFRRMVPAGLLISFSGLARRSVLDDPIATITRGVAMSAEVVAERGVTGRAEGDRAESTIPRLEGGVTGERAVGMP